VRLLSWNLNARRGLLADQLAAIARRLPDVLALQEITGTTVAHLRAQLPTCGLAHITDSFSSAPPWTAVGPRRYGLVIASRFPITERPAAPNAPWPERILTAVLETDCGGLTVHTTHIPPGSSNGWIKIEMLERVLEVVAASPSPCILCGDFNAPQIERAEGRIVTWAE
jgi:endonuclease/exonuclease/phosphatase family metal-dependent hydrolase